MAEQEDRYQPVPGLLQLPGFLVRKLSPRGQRRFRIGAAVAVVALCALAAVLIPKIADTKDENARRDREEAARLQAERIRALKAEQRPHFRDVPAGHPLAAAVKSAIAADALRRLHRGEVSNRAKRIDCDGSARPGGAVVYECMAVTSDIAEGSSNSAGEVGYPYRALAHPRARRFAFCKISGIPLEGSLTQAPPVPVPAACGG